MREREVMILEKFFQIGRVLGQKNGIPCHGAALIQFLTNRGLSVFGRFSRGYRLIWDGTYEYGCRLLREAYSVLRTEDRYRAFF